MEEFLKSLHHGLDTSLGKTVFLDNLELLYKENASFRNIEDEINDFFRLSRLIFFGRASKINQSNAYNWLKVFSLHCRLCERKLIIEKNELKRFNTPI